MPTRLTFKPNTYFKTETIRRRENKIKDWNKRTYLLDSQFLLLYSVRLMQLTLSYSCRFNWIGYCSYYSLSVSCSSGVVNFLFLFHISPKIFVGSAYAFRFIQENWWNFFFFSFLDIHTSQVIYEGFQVFHSFPIFCFFPFLYLSASAYEQ